MDVHFGGGVFGVAALEQVRNAARELHHFLASAHFAQSVVQDLAVLGSDDRGELVLAGVEQLAESEKDLGAAGQGGIAPCREGCFGGVDGGVTLLLAGQGNLPGDLPRGRVGDGSGAVPCRDVAAVDPVLDGVQEFSLVRGLLKAGISLSAVEPPQ